MMILILQLLLNDIQLSICYVPNSQQYVAIFLWAIMQFSYSYTLKMKVSKAPWNFSKFSQTESIWIMIAKE